MSFLEEGREWRKLDLCVDDLVFLWEIEGRPRAMGDVLLGCVREEV